MASPKKEYKFVLGRSNPLDDEAGIQRLAADGWIMKTVFPPIRIAPPYYYDMTAVYIMERDLRDEETQRPLTATTAAGTRVAP